MVARPLRIVHYLNQMFGGLGGEEAAGAAPRVVDGAVGPGRALAPILAPGESIVASVLCGDNYFAERAESVLSAAVRAARTRLPDGNRPRRLWQPWSPT